MALLEAAACGRPLIATDVPGCREIVQDNINGLLVPPHNAVALAAAMTRLVQDKDLRERMGAASRSRVLGDLSAEAVGTATLKLYESALVQSSAVSSRIVTA